MVDTRHFRSESVLLNSWWVNLLFALDISAWYNPTLFLLRAEDDKRRYILHAEFFVWAYTMLFGIWVLQADFKTIIRPFKSLYVHVGRIVIVYIMHHSLILTAKLYLRLEEKKMLGLFKLHEMIAGDLRSRDSISASTSGGAEADNAMNGADTSALNPPIILMTFWSLVPYQTHATYRSRTSYT